MKNYLYLCRYLKKNYKIQLISAKLLYSLCCGGPCSESRRGSLIPGSTSPRRGSLLPGASSSRRGSSELSSEDFDSDKFWSEQQKDDMPGGSTRSRRGSNVSLYGDVYAMKQENLDVPKIDIKKSSETR